MTTLAKKLTIPTAAIKAAAQAKAAARPAKAERPSLLTAARKAVDAGKLPPVLTFTSKANYSYNRHSEAMHELAKAGDAAGLKDYPLKGTNTYARALAGYRDLLMAAVKPAKAVKAPKAAKVAPAAKPAPKATKAPGKGKGKAKAAKAKA